MKINFLSDLHFEFGATEEKPSGDVLVLAGDFTVKAKQAHLDWLNSLDFKHVLYVFGNHESYRGSIDVVCANTKERVAGHVHVLENETVEIDGLRFHGATMWTDYDKRNPDSMGYAEGGMNDYRLIRWDNHAHRFTPKLALKFHDATLAYFKENVKEGDIVITHQAPSFKSIHTDFHKSRLNGAYASDLEYLIEELKPRLWFHGHVHKSFDYTVGGCRVLCNPRGYQDYEENADFDWHKQISIDID